MMNVQTVFSVMKDVVCDLGVVRVAAVEMHANVLKQEERLSVAVFSVKMTWRAICQWSAHLPPQCKRSSNVRAVVLRLVTHVMPAMRVVRSVRSVVSSSKIRWMNKHVRPDANVERRDEELRLCKSKTL